MNKLKKELLTSNHRQVIASGLKVLLACCLLISGMVVAEEAGRKDPARWLFTDNDGFVTTLPEVTGQSMSYRLITRIEHLQQRENHLQRELVSSQFNVSDVFITAVLPGGLIYAAVKQRLRIEKQNYLESVQGQSRELAAEYRIFSGSPAGEQVAAL